MNELNNIDQVGNIANLFSFTKIFLLLIGIIVLIFAVKSVSSFGAHVHRRYPSKRLFVAQAITISSFIIYMLGGTYIFFSIVHPPKALIVAVSGTLAVALGLSMKDLVASLVAGLILIFDKPFQVGDRITFKDMYGEVSTIGLRAVRIITLDDSVITIPNNQFISEAVSSGNFGALDMMIEVNFHIALNSDLEEAKKALYETAATSRFVYLKKPVTLVMTELEIANRIAMQIRVKSYVIDVRFEKALQTDLLMRGNAALIAKGIQRPVFEVSMASKAV